MLLGHIRFPDGQNGAVQWEDDFPERGLYVQLKNSVALSCATLADFKKALGEEPGTVANQAIASAYQWVDEDEYDDERYYQREEWEEHELEFSSFEKSAEGWELFDLDSDEVVFKGEHDEQKAWAALLDDLTTVLGQASDRLQRCWEEHETRIAGLNEALRLLVNDRERATAELVDELAASPGLMRLRVAGLL